jgi:hypothetical protein
MREVLVESEGARGAVPLANIGVRGRQRRMTNGVALLAAGGVGAALLIASGQPRAWRLVAFAPFWLGALGVFQAREKT